MESNIVKAKKITDISDQMKKAEVISSFLKYVEECITTFDSYFEPRRRILKEINALYRGKSWVNEMKMDWQTKSFIPILYDKIEAKTSMVFEAFWGNRLGSPFTVTGKTPEDHKYAFSAETYLNNSIDSIGFYETSEEIIRATVKYGITLARVGFKDYEDEFLWREYLRDNDGKVIRNSDGSAKLKYFKKKKRIRKPFVKNIDIVTNCGWDPSAKHINKEECGYAYEIMEMKKTMIQKLEAQGVFNQGVSAKIDDMDPHGINGFGEDNKIALRTTDGVNVSPADSNDNYKVVYWEGWYDIDDDGQKEFIKAYILGGKLLLSAEEILMGDYSFIDLQYSRSLHSITPWGVADPVINLQYQINELYNQRGDNNKTLLNQDWAINARAMLEDHDYTSMPSGLHPFLMDSASDDVARALRVIPKNPLNSVGIQEENRLINIIDRVTGVADFNDMLGTANKDTPASTLFGILDAQGTTNSMIVNGILNRMSVLGAKVLRYLVLFGDDVLVLRTIGKRGVEFREENIENLLGEYDVKIATSTFFGNRQMQVQNYIRMRPMWENSQHIDIVEVDKAIMEGLDPKRMEKVINIPDEPIEALDEQALFLAGQSESLDVSELENLEELQFKYDMHKTFEQSNEFNEAIKNEPILEYDWEKFMRKIEGAIQRKQLEMQAQAQQQGQGVGAQLAQGQPQPFNGNVNNTGSPLVREQGEMIRPNFNQ